MGALNKRPATYEKSEWSQALFIGRYSLVGLIVNAFGVVSGRRNKSFIDPQKSVKANFLRHASC
jgi:hypothetical protein